MQNFVRRRKGRNSQSGLTMIELLIAGMVFVVCMLGIVPLFMVAIGNNGRSKVDTTSTELAQSVIEQIVAVLASGGPPSMTDCGDPPTAWQIETAPTPAGKVPMGTTSIDFSAPVEAKYHMDFVVCGDTPVRNAVYDVRWRVDNISGSTDLVTVSAKPKMTMQKRFAFSLPVTVRTYVAPQ